MFDKKQKSCVKRIHLVTDDGLYDRKAFYTVKIVFYSSSTIQLIFLHQVLVNMVKILVHLLHQSLNIPWC